MNRTTGGLFEKWAMNLGSPFKKCGILFKNFYWKILEKMSECKLCSINQTEVHCSTNQMYGTDRQSSLSSSQDNEGKVFHLGIYYGCGCLCSFPSCSCRSIQSSCRHTDPGLGNLSVETGHFPGQVRISQQVRKQEADTPGYDKVTGLKQQGTLGYFSADIQFFHVCGFFCCCCFLVFNTDTKFFWLRIFYFEA